MSFIGTTEGYGLLAGFGIAMILIIWFFTKHTDLSNDDFLLAGRNVSWWLGAPSIAASWIWAPALFISSQMAYELGLPGLFWFVFPNMIAVAIFYFLGPKIREKFPHGTTLPEYIGFKLGNARVHKIYFLGYGFYQLMSVAVQIFAGASLTFVLTGIPVEISMILISGIVLAYSWLSGLKSSIVTDFVQLAMIFVGILLVVPAALNASGGIQGVLSGLGGISGDHLNLFDPVVAFSFGIVTSIGLISGILADQQYWQRTFAFEKKAIRRGFLAGAVLFGIVPVSLGLLGFMGAGLGLTVPAGTDPSLIGVLTVAHLLPGILVCVFFVMLLAGLASTMDSGLCAFSSLYAVDVKKYTDSRDLSAPKTGMLIITFAGLAVALLTAHVPDFGLKQLWWIFNAVAAALVIPTILSLYWDKLSAKGVWYGVVLAFVFGLPAFVFANIIGNTSLIVASALFIVLINIATAWVFQKNNGRLTFSD
ncbi:MAG: hypothetical protein J4215_01080 [Candidatus Diapherotrites archaeon]|uniref:Sodium:solute symporter family protein n=1 Tax=Candidatus Iainarchaeum sp. TaxID=3101447 RepID=A0A8T4L3L8_9ARCH|nr:hypothetical protein [Candidatus Diapherotrites archaeon]